MLKSGINLMIALERDEELHKKFIDSAGRIAGGVKVDLFLIDECVPDTRQDGVGIKTYKQKRSQNNDWRKSRGFNGYHREF